MSERNILNLPRFCFYFLPQYFWVINSNTTRIKTLSTKEISFWEGLLCLSFTASHCNWFFSVVIIEIWFIYSRIHLFKIYNSVTNVCSQWCDYHHNKDTAFSTKFICFTQFHVSLKSICLVHTPVRKNSWGEGKPDNYKRKWKLLSLVQLFATPWNVDQSF